MTILTAMSVARTDGNHWKVALYAGLATAVVALLMVLLRGVPFLGALLGILLGAAPLVGHDLARGAFGANWRSVIAGLIGTILFVVGIFLPRVWAEDFGWIAAGSIVSILSTILWSIVVGAKIGRAHV